MELAIGFADQRTRAAFFDPALSVTLQWPYKAGPARYKKALVILPFIVPSIDVPGTVAQVGGGSVRGKKKGIADGQLVLICGCVHDKGASWH
jgi:hypothetical protein